jgi:SAM-dependent methyltransferase
MELLHATPITQILGGYYSLWIVHAAARLGLADALARGPLTLMELARRLDAVEPSLERFLHAAAMLGLVQRQPDGTWALTPIGAWLRTDVPGSLHASALMCGDPSFFHAWTRLDEAVRSGRPSFELAHGASFFSYLDEHPGLLAQFQAAMTGFPQVNQMVLDVYDFAPRRAVLDVGGGSGSLVRAIVERHPGVKGLVLDRPSVIAAHQAAGRADPRLTWIGGDFLAELPEGADTHVLRFVLSDWSDADVVRILGNCRRALPPDGRLLIIDNLMPPDQPTFTAALDLTMLVLTGGRARSRDQYLTLLREAGFTLSETLTNPARATVLVAAPAA